MPIRPVVTKEEVTHPGPRLLKTPTGPRVKKLSESAATTFKALLFGPTGSGKTYAIKGLLEHGFKVFVISTDLGGDGLVTVKTALRDNPKLLENCTSVVLSTYKEVVAFLNNPESIYPDIYRDDPDWLVWDGFSSFQFSLLSDEIGEMTPQKAGDKQISDARESGLQLELLDWGMVRAGTIRNLDKFLKLHNRQTGKVWHKLLTCLEGMKSVVTGSGASTATVYKDSKEPMLQGSAAKLIGPAFDLILNTRVASKDEAGIRAYTYTCAGHDSLAGAKTRGIVLDPVESADFYVIWDKISKQLGIKKGDVDENILEKSLALESAAKVD